MSTAPIGNSQSPMSINPDRGGSRKDKEGNPMLLFEKISCHPRRAEPVTVSIPCGAILLGASSSSGATFAFNYPGFAAFAAARPLGLLAWFEYPEADDQAGGGPLPPLPRDLA